MKNLPLVHLHWSHTPGKVRLDIEHEDGRQSRIPLPLPLAHALSEAFLASAKVSPGIEHETVPLALFPDTTAFVGLADRMTSDAPPDELGVRKLADGTTALGLVWGKGADRAVWRGQVAGDPTMISNVILAHCAHAQGELTGYAPGSEA